MKSTEYWQSHSMPVHRFTEKYNPILTALNVSCTAARGILDPRLEQHSSLYTTPRKNAIPTYSSSKAHAQIQGKVLQCWWPSHCSIANHNLFWPPLHNLCSIPKQNITDFQLLVPFLGKVCGTEQHMACSQSHSTGPSRTQDKVGPIFSTSA